MNKARFVGALLGALSFTTLTTSAALAAEPDAAAKADAAKRFDRGLTLFDEGDNAGALAEFKQVYSTMPNPVVLYNIGLVYAAMQRPVDAVDALVQVVNDSKLSPAQHERAEKTLNDQQARIGRLSITSTPSGAHISIDNVDVATTPLKAPLRVSAGSHVVGAIAPGFAMARQEVVVAGNAEATLDFKLLRAEATRDASLMIHSRLTGAELLVNGKSVGKTPFSTSIAVPPGHVKLELRRPGYTPATQELDLGEGATSDVSLDPAIDQKAVANEGVLLALDVGRTNAELYVDQEHIGAYTGPVRLPQGPHRVRVEAAGFMPLERSIVLVEGKSNVINDKLEPTPESRAAHDASVSTHRLWGWIGVGAGALIAGGGAAWLGINSGTKSDARKTFDTANAATENDPNDESVCDKGSAFADPTQCTQNAADALVAYDDAKKKDIIGFVGIGVGAAVAVTGVVILLTGPGKDEYGALSPEKSRRSRWALTGGPGNLGGLGLVGSF